MATFIPEMRLHDTDGQRLYLTEGERKKFLAAAEHESPEIQMFCQILHYTGCRPSEVLELSASRIKIDEKIIVVRTLKKRKFDNQGRQRKPQFRQIPVPGRLINELNLVFNLHSRLANKKKIMEPFWKIHKATAWRNVKKVMANAGIIGPQATSKGLRHGYGVALAAKKLPITLIRDLLGHADTKTTEIYMQIVGDEKRDLVMSVWNDEK